MKEFKGTCENWWNPELSTEIIAMPSQIKIARVFSVDNSENQEAMQANARLIANAPSLLQSNILLLDAIEMLYNEVNLWSDKRHQVDVAISAARNAINQTL